MRLTERFLSFTLLGSEWVLWVLIALSIISIAIMIERAYYFATHRVDSGPLAEEIKRLIRKGDVAGARARLKDTSTVEERVAAAGLEEIDYGPDAVGEAMLATKAVERLKLERNLAVLGTLGNNTPFIGLFGTVLGIIKASHDLTATGGGGEAANAVMSGVFEALVATAIGLLVAIPAVVAFNVFNRRVRATMSGVDNLAHTILTELHSRIGGRGVNDAKDSERRAGVK
ncbi:MAG: MotA/TolQ/ExbB proton channel family protein [Polyangia bacterium]